MAERCPGRTGNQAGDYAPNHRATGADIRAAMMTRILAILALTIIGIVATPGTASATAQADSLDIEAVYGFRHLAETDDMLILVHYDIEYSSIPDEPANDTYLFRLMNGTTEIGRVLPYPYGSYQGYNEGVVGFYYSAADAPTYGQSYEVVLQGNPAVFHNAETWKTTYTMLAANWSTYTTEDQNRALLRLKVAEIANSLEIDWSTTLLTIGQTGESLNATGEAYFIQAVLGLRTMCPSCFAINTAGPEFSDRTWNRTYDKSLRTTLAGTPMEDAIKVFQRNANMSWMAAGGFLLMIAFAIVVFAAVRAGGTASDGFICGIPVILAGVRCGVIPMADYAIFALIGVMVTGYVLYVRYSS